MHMQPVRGLLEYDRLRTVRYCRFHLHISLHRQAVHEDRCWPSLQPSAPRSLCTAPAPTAYAGSSGCPMLSWTSV